MKKTSVVVLALSLAVSMFGIAEAGRNGAGMGMGMGMGMGCATCPQAGAASEPFRKFQSDTIDLRQEMMTKRFEIQRENLKATPDKEKIAALRAEISTLQTKIMDVRSKSGLPVNRMDGECGQRMGRFGHQGMGFCGKGMGPSGNVPNVKK